MSTIRILSVIDCDSIINNSSVPAGTLSNPTYLGSYQTSNAYAYMMVQQSYAVNGNGESELTVQAQVGDVIQWTIGSIDSGLSYNVILQGIGLNQGENNGGAIGPVNPQQLQFKEFTGPPQTSATPTGIVSLQYTENILYAMVGNTSASQVQYNVSFYITDTKGNILGYYYWDPFINITN